MAKNQPTISVDLQRLLDGLADEEQAEALLYAGPISERLEQFLEGKKEEGVLEYNVLEMAGCVALRAARKVILELADLEEVSRLETNPRFSTQS